MGESLGRLQALDAQTGQNPSPVPEEQGAVLGSEARNGDRGSGHGPSLPAQPSRLDPLSCPRGQTLCPRSQAGWISLIQLLWDHFSSKLPLFHSVGPPPTLYALSYLLTPFHPLCSYPILSSPSHWPHRDGSTGAQFCLPLCGTNEQTRILAPRHCGVAPQGLQSLCEPHHHHHHLKA